MTPRIRHITTAVATAYELDPQALSRKGRPQPIAEARQVAMAISRDQTQLSATVIARHFGKRDHGTVIYACKRVSDLYDSDKQFRARFQGIVRGLARRENQTPNDQHNQNAGTRDRQVRNRKQSHRTDG